MRLLAANFIKETRFHTWVADIVLVKKPNGKWRMCVDYTDLNKECPKDVYHLPCIDQLVDATTGHDLLSFMDVYSGYNKIMVHPEIGKRRHFMLLIASRDMKLCLSG